VRLLVTGRCGCKSIGNFEVDEACGTRGLKQCSKHVIPFLTRRPRCAANFSAMSALKKAYGSLSSRVSDAALCADFGGELSQVSKRHRSSSESFSTFRSRGSAGKKLLLTNACSRAFGYRKACSRALAARQLAHIATITLTLTAE
jgi:hypothetical protein